MRKKILVCPLETINVADSRLRISSASFLRQKLNLVGNLFDAPHDARSPGLR